MAGNTVLYEKSDGVGTISLNRPEKLNAINWDMLDDLSAVLKDILVDDEVSVVVLRGEGRYFCSGADLEIVGTLEPATFRSRQRLYWNRVFGQLEDIEKLTICALNGPAIGGGVELALCCDLRYAAENAHFSLPQLRYGIVPDAGATIRLPSLIGAARAKELIIGGESVDARRAEGLGLVNAVLPQDTFDEEVRKIALGFAGKAPLAVGMVKLLINRSAQHNDVRRGLEEAMDVQSYLITTEDYEEAVSAFKEKRPPKFKRR
jgi:enoyl-CoA hydratase/carnithine racemase